MSERGGGVLRRSRLFLPAFGFIATIGCATVALPAQTPEKTRKPEPHPWAAAGRPVHVETVSFANPRQAPVRVIRGAAVPRSPPGPGKRTEILNFANRGRVAVVRGALPPAAEIGRTVPAVGGRLRVETVAFADPRKSPVTVVRGPPVTVVRGPPLGGVADELFAPAAGGELDRIAFAVDGIESRHGADPGMWRPEPDGPQGPMQVSLKAAIDVGGGDRFDLRQNRLLGRAYLAHLYRRYGDWPDALAAYNWGPGNLDQWIAEGRRAEMLPIEVNRYVARALRDALLTTAANR